MCKIVFSITFNLRFWCPKEPSHREDSFEHQKCLSENIIVDLRIISCHLNGILFGDRCGSDIVGWLGLLVMTCKTKR